MAYERMLDEGSPPGEADIAATIGNVKVWNDLRDYLDRSYQIEPELIFYGKKYGWTIRYRKGGKTLCSLFPEHGAFTVLIVLGKKEAANAAEFLDELSSEIQELIGGTSQSHDGKWLWIRVLQTSVRQDVERLLTTKRKPANSAI